MTCENTTPITGEPIYRDLVVIGGGAAGLAAAASAYDNGVRDIVILEREGATGGILKQCIHNGFGLHRFDEELAGPEYALREAARVAERNIEVRLNTMVLSLTDDRRVVAVSPDEGLVEYVAGAVVLAMGSRERTRGMLGIAGSRPAGVYTAGTAQQFTNLRGILPGREVVMLGSGDIGLIMARRLVYEGAHVKMVLNRSHFSGGLKRNIVQCLDDYGIPLRLSHTITRIHGRARLTGVDVARVDPATKKPIPGSEEFVPCDTLLLSVGLLPENELTRAAGIAMDRRSNGALVDETLSTSAPGIFSCGNVLHIHDLVDFVSEEGDRAGESAARYLAGAEGAAGSADVVRVVPGDGVGYVVPQVVHKDAQGQVTFRFRSRDVYKKATIAVVADGEMAKTFRRPIVLPAEMESVKLPVEAFAGASELKISLDAEQVGARADQAAAAEPAEQLPEGAVAHDLVCISCPVGCMIHAVEQDGKIVSVTGNTCRRGLKYAEGEVLDPQRMVTCLVDVEESAMPASVRTERTVPKRLIPDVLAELRRVTLTKPVRCGDVVFENVCGTGVNVVATKDVL
ncbi:Benzene 1,2-dioxygenase system ferredoxin--NAD(+) reductase subunit [Slackia heliotrinireducens]|uniref:Uncharacterized protein with conserved CXXC pairs n=1 Tax=Slackia heliotrinireducens (strain ATCC 29202 / DSM 20476 / NCTC 11029 / RHS 1) TaxID=471855 RepID=C7N3U6_SLAHD|nr:FAD-dependent oxidoreductase [Slackia heliotrinireducens]ACV21687.1 uncharacterized protein with conserved CXXC pairs [Slackia heliotrinireducens DSM 20476]VEG99315.1 Benzene 1,2-dioxygenase system ferredoxin--NAD(+) reductase subunit [Slackia heliotrinireducens]